MKKWSQAPSWGMALLSTRSWQPGHNLHPHKMRVPLVKNLLASLTMIENANAWTFYSNEDTQMLKKNHEKCSTLLIISEMQMKLIVKCSFVSARIVSNALWKIWGGGNDWEELDTKCIAVGNTQQLCYGKQYEHRSKLKHECIHLPHNCVPRYTPTFKLKTIIKKCKCIALFRIIFFNTAER